MKKLLCLLLAMLMVVSVFAGCGKKEEEKTSEPDSAATDESDATEEEAGDEEENPAEEAEVVEFDYFRSRINGNAITDYTDALWAQEWQERMNVKINFLGPNSGDDYTEAVNILLASNDLPELLYHNWNNYNGGLAAAIADGVIVDVSANEDYKALMPTWFGMLEENKGLYASVTLDDGTSAMFCHVELDLKRGAYAGYAIRQDWLENVGITEIPETVDDLYAALTAFKEQDANGNGDAADEIPATDDSGLSLFTTLAGSWGLRYNQPYRAPGTETITYWTEYNDGANYLDFVKTMRQWYEEGLWDPEFISQDGSAREAKITSDQAGLFFAYTGNYAQWVDALKEYTGNENVNLYGMINVKGEDGVSYSTNDALNRPAAANEGTCVTSAAVDNGNIEAILKAIDYLYTEEGSELISWGVEGESYTKDAEGNHTWTDMVLNDPEYSFNDKVLTVALPTWGSWPKVMSYEAWASVEVTTPESTIAHDNYYNVAIDLCMPMLMMTEEEATEYNQIMTDANTAISEATTGYILGNKTDADLENMLSTIDGMGIDRAIEIYQGVYDRYLAKIQ